MVVWLGGTCSGYRWRDDLIKKINCDYINPMTKGWNESKRGQEVNERETSDIVLYGITKDIKGFYSIAEVVDDSNKRPNKTIFLLASPIEEFGRNSHSIKAVIKLLESNGIKIFYNIDDCAYYINSLNN